MAEGEGRFPIPPLGDWGRWLWTILERYRLLSAAGIALAVLVASLVIPLVAAWLLSVAAYFGNDYPRIDKLRNWYVEAIQDGFEVLHKRIDYVDSFEAELGGSKSPRVVLLRSMDAGQHVELVLKRVRVVPLSASLPRAAAPNPSKSASRSACSLIAPTKSSARPSGVLKISVSGVSIRSINETDESQSIRLDSSWWQKHGTEVLKISNPEMWLDAVDLGQRSSPEGCATLIVEGQIRVYKNHFAVRGG